MEEEVYLYYSLILQLSNLTATCHTEIIPILPALTHLYKAHEFCEISVSFE